MTKKAKILFFVPSLGGGGAEMHLLRLMNRFNQENKFNITLALIKRGGTYEKSLNRGIVVHHLAINSIVNSNTLSIIQAIPLLQRLIQHEKPDLLFSIMDNANLAALTAIQSLIVRPKIIIGVQIPPSIQFSHSKSIFRNLFLRLIPHLYPKADHIVALSKGVGKDLVTLVPKAAGKISIIYNANIEQHVLSSALTPSDAIMHPQIPLIVGCGRLTEQKGFPYLIEALQYVRQVIPACLWIIGEGEQRSKLEVIIQKLDLVNHVKLLGFQSNPFKYMAMADVFVLSSLWEGFGNVIVEAMACGTPVIATNCPFGPAEIITDRINGLLVPTADVHSLAAAIVQVLTNLTLKQQLSEQGRIRAQDFDTVEIANQYEYLFLQTLNETS